MKRILFLAAILGLASFWACDPKPTNALNVSTPATVKVEGGDVKFKIVTTADWEITKKAEDTWFSLTPLKGKGDQEITATVAANDGPERSSIITVKAAGNEPKNVKLTQSGVAGLFITVSTPAIAPKAGGSVTFAIQSNVDWTISPAKEAWVTKIDPMAGKDNATITVTVSENAAAERTSTLTIQSKDGTISKNVVISQEGIQIPLIDKMVGQWSVEGYFLYVADGSTTKVLDDEHVATIEKVDAQTIKIHDLAGYTSVYKDVTAEQDIFTATINGDNATITIPWQESKPAWDPSTGWKVYLTRILEGEDFAASWGSGFDNIPISVFDMTFDLSKGGKKIEIDGEEAHISHAALTRDEAKPKEVYYFCFSANTVFTKKVSEGAPAPLASTAKKVMKMGLYKAPARR